MKVAVLGSSLTALVAATALASTGNDVVLLLPDNTTGRSLLAGDWPYREAGLQTLMNEQRASKRLFFLSLDDAALPVAQVYWIATEPGELPLVEQFWARLPQPQQPLVAVVQTSFPLGTSEQLAMLLEQVFPERETAVVCFPEMLQGGVALESFMRPVSLFAGIEKPFAEDVFRELMRPFNRLRDVLHIMRLREAEFTKLSINGMLATRLGFMNEMAALAETLGVDIDVVRQGMGSDTRIGESYLYPGCGFGGSKFSRNLQSLVEVLHENDVSSSLLDQVLKINEQQKELLFRKLWRHYDTRLAGRTVALWGVAYKPGTERGDEAPSLAIIKALLAQQVTVAVHDPKALSALADVFPGETGIRYHNDPYNALQDADALMLVTEWKHYWSPDFPCMKQLMREPVLLDGRNIYSPDYVTSQGFTYYGIGRG